MIFIKKIILMTESEVREKIENTYKFLFMDHFRGIFDLQEITCTDISISRSNVSGFYIDLRVDYLKSGGGSAKEWGKLLREIELELLNFFDEYSFSNSKNKIVYKLDPKEFFVNNIYFDKMNLVFDEKHEVSATIFLEKE